jgi:two-component system chemotaxis response regulator CheY
MPAARSLKVLIVDDQFSMRSLMRAGLQQIGIVDIDEASDGDEALRMVVKAPVNLIISDFNMPKFDGISLLRAVRAHEPIKGTAFIMLTGRADKELVLRAIQHGVNNYLVKPFSIAALKEKIEAVLGALT